MLPAAIAYLPRRSYQAGISRDRSPSCDSLTRECVGARSKDSAVGETCVPGVDLGIGALDACQLLRCRPAAASGLRSSGCVSTQNCPWLDLPAAAADP